MAFKYILHYFLIIKDFYLKFKERFNASICGSFKGIYNLLKMSDLLRLAQHTMPQC